MTVVAPWVPLVTVGAMANTTSPARLYALKDVSVTDVTGHELALQLGAEPSAPTDSKVSPLTLVQVYVVEYELPELVDVTTSLGLS